MVAVVCFILCVVVVFFLFLFFSRLLCSFSIQVMHDVCWCASFVCASWLDLDHWFSVWCAAKQKKMKLIQKTHLALSSSTVTMRQCICFGYGIRIVSALILWTLACSIFVVVIQDYPSDTTIVLWDVITGVVGFFAICITMSLCCLTPQDLAQLRSGSRHHYMEDEPAALLLNV